MGAAVATGSLWLPSTYPQGPCVRIWSEGVQPAMSHLFGGTRSAFESSVPVAGPLYLIKPGGQPGLAEWSALGRIAWRELEAVTDAEELRALIRLMGG